MPKSESFAIATQQSYAAGKAPSGYGTKKGRKDAGRKYEEPKSQYEQTADPSHKVKSSANLTLWKGFSDELEKISAAKGPMMIGQSLPTYSKSPAVKLPSETKSGPMDRAKSIPPPPATAG